MADGYQNRQHAEHIRADSVCSDTAKVDSKLCSGCPSDQYLWCREINVVGFDELKIRAMNTYFTYLCAMKGLNVFFVGVYLAEASSP